MKKFEISKETALELYAQLRCLSDNVMLAPKVEEMIDQLSEFILSDFSSREDDLYVNKPLVKIAKKKKSKIMDA